jgi:hypothetical protein
MAFASSKYLIGFTKAMKPTMTMTCFSKTAYKTKLQYNSSGMSYNITNTTFVFGTRDSKCSQLWPSITRRYFSSGHEKGGDRWSIKKWMVDFLGPKKMPERHTFAWYREICLICTVFAITGSSTMILVSLAFMFFISFRDD